MSHDPKYELTEAEILEKLTDRCRSENPRISSNIDSILSSATVQNWVRELPSITDHLFVVLNFKNLEQMVTKDFVYEYYFKSLVEEQQSHPECDVISDLYDLSCYAENQGGFQPRIFPVKSIKELREHYQRIAPDLRDF